MLSMLEAEKKENFEKLIILKHFLNGVYDRGRGKNDFEKTHSVITLFFVCYLRWRKRNNPFLKNSFCDNIIFCMLSMMLQEKKRIFQKLIL